MTLRLTTRTLIRLLVAGIVAALVSVAVLAFQPISIFIPPGSVVMGPNQTIQLQDGSTSAPSLTFANDTSLGFSRPSANNIGFDCCAGTPQVKAAFMGGNGIGIASNLNFSWSNSTSDATAVDTFLARAASGKITLTGSVTSIGPEFSAGTASPTVTACGTGGVSAHSTNTAGEVTATGATSCTVTFGANSFTNTPFCIIEEETTLATHRISAISTASFTVTGLTSGDKFMYQCVGGK